MKQPESSLTVGEMLGDLTAQGLLESDDCTRIESYLAGIQANQTDPWFVKLLMAFGAWVAAVCFVFFLGMAGLIKDEAATLFGWGAMFLIAATLLRRSQSHIFFCQLALAISCAGHGFMLAGAASISTGDGQIAAVAVAAVLLCGVLYPLYPDSLHRFLSCLLAAGCVTAWIVEAEMWPLIHVEMLAKILAIGIVFMYRPNWRELRPLGYAMSISVPATLFLVLLPTNVFTAPWWPANAVLATSLIWLYQWIAGGWSQLRSEPMLIAIAATVCLASFTTPGILAALGLMVLGYSRDDRYLMSIGVLFFPIFIVVFYYEWEISLLVKSWIMVGSGATLLAARWLLELRNWAKE